MIMSHADAPCSKQQGQHHLMTQAPLLPDLQGPGLVLRLLSGA